ncbi:MAG TPA: FecR domain-containing protein [Bacteroidales bacterium]|nr:FecR domain-containing protein [Bacteroidales bacterium]
MKNRKIHPEKEWEELASMLSGEKEEEKDLVSRFADDDIYTIKEQWVEMRNNNTVDNIDVDRAWNSVYSRIKNQESAPVTKVRRLDAARWMKVAAAFILLSAIGAVTFYAGKNIFNKNTVTIATTADQRNIPVDLPDGSRIYMNRNSRLSYQSDLGKVSRHVKLEGEAFFQIAPDAAKPFTIDAGKAEIKVVGTSFNVITENPDNAVEVFVKTGKVLVTDQAGEKSISLDPGFIGKMSSAVSEKTENADPNYMAWNTGILDYKGQKLDVVFRDLKKVYNMEIIADDPSILENAWSSYIDNLTQDKIILLICTSFNLSYTKDGNVYHLERK